MKAIGGSPLAGAAPAFQLVAASRLSAVVNWLIASGQPA